MANKELSGLTAAGALDATELALLSQGGSSRKITLSNLMKVIDALTAETAPAVGDELAIYDASAATADKITLANLLKIVNALTAETSPATDDELLLYDLSAGTADKITLANFLTVINALTEDTSPDKAADYVVTYDASAAAAKKALLSTIGPAASLAFYGTILGSLSNRDYTIVLKAGGAGTIAETTTKCVSGTATATFKIESTALGGTANAVSSSEQSQAHSTNNAFAAGNDIIVTISANSSCVDMSFTIKWT